MLDNTDIWRAALLILNQLGDQAEAECEKRAEDLAATSNEEGAATWRLIGLAVRQLADTRIPSRERLN